MTEFMDHHHDKQYDKGQEYTEEDEHKKKGLVRRLWIRILNV